MSWIVYKSNKYHLKPSREASITNQTIMIKKALLNLLFRTLLKSKHVFIEII